jgi:hypothetical protein
MSKHTPGPWVFSAIDSTEGFLVVEKARPKSLVATVCKRNGCGWACPHEEPWANARLIAAAPDLLEACKAAERSPHHPACPIATGKGQTTITHDDCTCHVGKARVAIAKAEGQEVPHA